MVCAADAPLPGDTWNLDEGFLKINGQVHYLWWAVDQEFSRKLLKGLLGWFLL
jgi:transposase-like protein